VAYIPNRIHFADTAARVARNTDDDIPAASFANGMNNGAMTPIGIGAEYPNLSGQPQQFTLLDQTDPDGLARVPQNSSSLGLGLLDGTTGIVQACAFMTNHTQDELDANPELGGAPDTQFPADLVTLAAGWVPNEI
jgi:hypothetical protein